MGHISLFSIGVAFNGNYKVGSFQFTMWGHSWKADFPYCSCIQQNDVLCGNGVPDTILLSQLLTGPWPEEPKSCIGFQPGPEWVRFKLLRVKWKDWGLLKKLFKPLPWGWIKVFLPVFLSNKNEQERRWKGAIALLYYFLSWKKRRKKKKAGFPASGTTKL